MTEKPALTPPSDPDPTFTMADDGQPELAVGPYRLLQKVGEGGMGEVWLARQTHPVHRDVALKILKAGMDTKHVVARFEAERQALALMDHPAIATVFDGGATSEGRPYFAMEYVKGEPLIAYSDRHLLSTRERLELFIQICEGVQHAHQKGIIHRDLKPSNVLVTFQNEKPVPKIIDFGVAKATAQPLAESTLFTELGVLIGTPEYMSPEQVEPTRLDIDTRSDVYSLGVLLYELLTGTLPLDQKLLRERALDEIRRSIREIDPPRPSARITQMGADSTETARRRHTEPARLASQLRGDLDWITMKALEKDRTRRYDTVTGLANDVRSHLENKPVVAGPPSAAYRARKFVRRHRFGVGAAVALVALLFAFGATMAWQAQRIARERDRANDEAKTAKAVSDFLVGLFEVSQPSEAAADSVKAREILDAGARRAERELRGQPKVQASMMSTMGRAYASLGLYKTAERLQRTALELRQQTAGPQSLQAATAMLSLAYSLSKQGRYAEAESMARDAVSAIRALPEPADAALAEGLAQLSSAVYRQGRRAEGETLAREALLVSRRLPPGKEQFLSLSLSTLGAMLMAKADYSGAEDVFAEALDINRASLGPSHPGTLRTLSNVAAVWIFRGQYAKAEDAYRQIVAAQREQLGPSHPHLATSLNNLGAVLFKQRKYGAAEDAYREAATIARRSLGDSHPEVAPALKNIGQTLGAQGRYLEAERLIREALAIELKALGGDHTQVALTLIFLSDALRRAGKAREAEQVAREALAINSKRLGPEHPRTKEAGGTLGLALVAQRRWPEAEPLLLENGAALEAEGGYGNIASQIAAMYDAWGKPEKAAEWRRKSAATKK